ncbi:B12-binding domain-containing radical SAM protein [Thermodesulfobacteriota bacterium]
MKVLFLNPLFGSSHPEGLDAPLGLMYLGAVLKQAGHQCELVDHTWECARNWQTWDNAVAREPDVVLINTHIRFSDTTAEAVRRVKANKAQVPVMAFGPQASTEALRLISEMGFDACVLGEPEGVMPAVLDAFASSGRLESRTGLATPGELTPGEAPRVDVEALPFPDWEWADYGRYIKTTHNAVFMCSRGYEQGDVFNQPPLIYATQPTYRCSVDRVISELTELRRRFPGFYMLLFHDEVFTENREWVIELCSRLRQVRLGVPYWCFTRPDLVDADLCRIMHRAGFAGLSMGMESGSERVLGMLKRCLTSYQTEKGFRAAQRAGLLTIGSVMIGTPGYLPEEQGETWEEIKSTEKMVNRLHPDVLTITLTTPLPGTPLYENSKDRILAKTPEEYNYYHVWPGKYPLRLDNLTPDDLTAGVNLIRRTWKWGLWRTAWRITQLALQNGAFRNTLCSHLTKVICRKVLIRT